MMRVPTPSEPKCNTFPTYQVPQESAMRGRAPQPVQHEVARAFRGGRADPPTAVPGASLRDATSSVITGSSWSPARGTGSSSNIKLQSVTENCLLNFVTEPKIQRIDLCLVANNNSTNNYINNNNNVDSDKLDDSSKFGALLLGQDIPNQKSEDLELSDDLTDALKTLTIAAQSDNNDKDKEPTAAALCNKKQKLGTAFEDDETYSVPLRLRGGGESSLSTGTSGWGSPPSQQASNNNSNKNNSNGQQPPTSQSGGSAWPQPGSKPTTGSNGPPTTTASSNNNAQNNATNTTKQQLEQLNNMREAIFSQDGWGGQHVNQDTNWDIPASPEPSMKMDGSGPPTWKPAVNNGTELWEANLRNGGQPPPPPQQKTPWGHTPSSNIGGTWGEEDDAGDSSNVWNGAPSNQQQWGNNSNNAMWGGTTGGNNSGWGDPRAPADPRANVAAAAAVMDGIRPELRAVAAASGLDPRQLDPREQMRQIAGGDMRGDPRGITGRLNGPGADFWGQSGPHGGPGGMHHQNKIPIGPGNGGGWEEPSPPSQRRNIPNFDDGTSLWGNPQQAHHLGHHWKDLPATAGGMGGGRGGPPGMAPGRKPDGVWGGGGGRNGWDEVSGPSGGWGDDPSAAWGKHKGPGIWDTNELEWGHKSQKIPPLTKEQVWNSKQFRMLVDMGHKKDEVEHALRLREMNVEEALDILSPPTLRGRNNDGWGNRHDDHFDHSQFPGAQRSFPGLGGPAANPLGGGFPSGGVAPGLLNSMGGAGGQANGSLINNISPALVQKMLAQQGGAGVGGQGYAGPSPGRPMQPQNQPSTQQLKMLVQQIQLAVQAGYLNHQILNQPLAPQTLVLLNQLLQQIKNLQQLTQQQMAASTSKANVPNSTMVQYSVLITKTKQQIVNIQNQIQAQQAYYVKQQQGIGYDSFKTTPMHESINALQGNFGDLNLNKDPNQQQSRLNQWINKDKEENSEFSRAPGSSSKPVATSPNMAPLGLTQNDGPWSSGRSADTGWPDSNGGDSSNDVKDAQWATTAQTSLTDLVPEFEPGKPWKGNQIKSIEDDPTITPGSVVRSPLSIATIKETDLFNMNTTKSPPATDSMQSLSSSTWSFNPPATSGFTSSSQIKLPTTKGGLVDLNPGIAVTSELWGAPKLRGPPPGLSGKGGGGSLANGWSGGPLTGTSSASWGGSSGAGQRNSGNWGGGTGGSQWLLLRNLTAQIDGSTLRTLCMQHGPLHSFHLHLHQGFALAKYSSREEAIKAQTALHNCVLGNTTILAENPTDWDANTLLQSIANQAGSSGAWRNSSSKPAGDTWSTGWSNNPSSLWGNTPLDSSDAARTTPSSLNSFLPNDLLGGESM